MSNYPATFDTDENLYLVRDALKIPLGADYHPGQNIIIADGDISRFPLNGIITLVDQDSPAHERAVSFHYNHRTNREFLNLELLENCIDCFKPKKFTIITMQVMSDHREAIKDAILSIEKFLGPKHTVNNTPNGDTVFGRINFLRKILFEPKAWFEVDKITGAAPLTVNFTFTGTGNTGPVGEVEYIWNFGDEDELKTTEHRVQKLFVDPGDKTVSLTIKNQYGEDSVSFPGMVKVKGQAPEQALVRFAPQQQQLGFMQNDIMPRIRAQVRQPITIEIPQKMVSEKRTFAGERIDPNTSRTNDAITNYTWNLGDDLPHANSPKTKALYSVGGLYDLVVRTDTASGTHRTTVYPNAIDVVEPINIWLWTINNKNIKSHEFGLLSEVFKTSNNSTVIEIDDSFIDDNHKREKFEFWRNNGSAKKGDIKSGQGGELLMFWATGRDRTYDPIAEKINFVEYNGFSDTYISKDSILGRPWNWVSLSNNNKIYFALGNNVDGPLPTLSMTNQSKITYNIDSSTTSSEEIEYRNYKNGAQNLILNPDVFDSNFNAENGHFSAYRTTWKNNTGYILRNSHLGENFSFREFYRTEGTIGLPFQNIVKLLDLPGENHKDGDLAAISNGVYFFNNSGMTYCYGNSTGTWELITPHNKIAINDLDGLMATSDSDNKAYLSLEGINNGFIKFNGLDMSYTTLNQKPTDQQWHITLF
jgi:PKD repeat protein